MIISIWDVILVTQRVMKSVLVIQRAMKSFLVTRKAMKSVLVTQRVMKSVLVIQRATNSVLGYIHQKHFSSINWGRISTPNHKNYKKLKRLKKFQKNFFFPLWGTKAPRTNKFVTLIVLTNKLRNHGTSSINIYNLHNYLH